MNTDKLMKEIYLLPEIQKNVSMQVQLGLPGVLWKNGRLMLRFLPHNEKLVDGRMLFYAATYDITVDYPGMKLMAFRNLAVLDGASADAPLAACDTAFLLGGYKDGCKELYRLLSGVLEAHSRNELTEKMVDEYNGYLDRLIVFSGLQEIYQSR